MNWLLLFPELVSFNHINLKQTSNALFIVACNSIFTMCNQRG